MTAYKWTEKMVTLHEDFIDISIGLQFNPDNRNMTIYTDKWKGNIE